MTDSISGADLAKLLVGKTIKEVKLADVHGHHLGVEELCFTDGSAVCLSGSSDQAYVWEYKPADGDAVLVINESD